MSQFFNIIPVCRHKHSKDAEINTFICVHVCVCPGMHVARIIYEFVAGASGDLKRLTIQQEQHLGLHSDNVACTVVEKVLLS
jgi:hypothetical protein